MDYPDEKLAGTNIEEEPIKVRHADLKRDDPRSVIHKFRSTCPVCKSGVLLGRRDGKTFEILAEDNCTLCGQRFIYTDL